MNIEVIGAHASLYPDPIRFEIAESLTVGREDPDNPGWFWCHAVSGREGWVHDSFLSARAGEACGVRSYDGRELTVFGGERGIILEDRDGWTLVRLAGGDVGWLPGSHVTPDT